MSATVKVRLVRYWNGNGRGSVLTLNKPVADLLVEHGAAVLEEDAPPEVKRVVGEKIKNKSLSAK